MSRLRWGVDKINGKQSKEYWIDVRSRKPGGPTSIGRTKNQKTFDRRFRHRENQTEITAAATAPQSLEIL